MLIGKIWFFNLLFINMKIDDNEKSGDIFLNLIDKKKYKIKEFL
jgi:hypothetical protein